jgi:hypothetical protein
MVAIALGKNRNIYATGLWLAGVTGFNKIRAETVPWSSSQLTLLVAGCW